MGLLSFSTGVEQRWSVAWGYSTAVAFLYAGKKEGQATGNGNKSIRKIDNSGVIMTAPGGAG